MSIHLILLSHHPAYCIMGMGSETTFSPSEPPPPCWVSPSHRVFTSKNLTPSHACTTDHIPQTTNTHSSLKAPLSPDFSITHLSYSDRKILYVNGEDGHPHTCGYTDPIVGPSSPAVLYSTLLSHPMTYPLILTPLTLSLPTSHDWPLGFHQHVWLDMSLTDWLTRTRRKMYTCIYTCIYTHTYAYTYTYTRIYTYTYTYTNIYLPRQPTHVFVVAPHEECEVFDFQAHTWRLTPNR